MNKVNYTVCYKLTQDELKNAYIKEDSPDNFFQQNINENSPMQNRILNPIDVFSKAEAEKNNADDVYFVENKMIHSVIKDIIRRKLSLRHGDQDDGKNSFKIRKKIKEYKEIKDSELEELLGNISNIYKSMKSTLV